MLLRLRAFQWSRAWHLVTQLLRAAPHVAHGDDPLDLSVECPKSGLDVIPRVRVPAETLRRRLHLLATQMLDEAGMPDKRIVTLKGLDLDTEVDISEICSKELSMCWVQLADGNDVACFSELKDRRRDPFHSTLYIGSKGIRLVHARVACGHLQAAGYCDKAKRGDRRRSTILRRTCHPII